MRFLLVEDNRELARDVIARLALDGHTVDHAHDLQAADACTGTHRYDLVLLDIHLPDGDGRDFLARRPNGTEDVPVIVVTARSAVADRIGLLDGGADDYITKPVDLAELAARCRAVLRRHGRGTETVTLGDVVVDPDGATVTVAGEVRALRNRELRLLQVLARPPGRLHSKARLHDRIFGVLEAVSDNAIEVYVARLRKSLAGSADVRIETVRGVGYRLTVG